MATRKTKKKPAEAEDSQEKTGAQSFEESMDQLSKIVEELEEGELSLEASLQRFEEGVRLARTSQARLDDAESRVEILLGLDADGKVVAEEFEPA